MHGELPAENLVHSFLLIFKSFNDTYGACCFGFLGGLPFIDSSFDIMPPAHLGKLRLKSIICIIEC